MMLKPLFRIVISILVSFSALTGQTYRFKTFDSEKDGIYPYIYSLHQDSKGFIWLGTGEGLFRYDGHNFINFDISEASQNNFISSGTSDLAGNNWFGLNNGEICYFNGKSFNRINLPKGNYGAITSITTMRDGSVWASSLNNGLLKISPEKTVQVFSSPFDNMQIYCAVPSGKFILAGTGEGLYIFNPLKPDTIILLKNSPLTKIECIYFSKILNKYFVGTEDEGIFSLSLPHYNIEKLLGEPGLDNSSVKDIVVDKNKAMWVATFGNGAYYISLIGSADGNKSTITSYNPGNGLNSLNVRKLMIDNESNIWFGTYGNGLMTFLENYFSFLLQENDEDIPVYSVAGNGIQLWAGTKGSLIKFPDKALLSHSKYSQDNNVPDDKITAIFFQNDGTMWFGTEKKGIYTFNTTTNKAEKFFMSQDMLMNSISSIAGYDSLIIAGTRNGLLITGSKTKNIEKLTTAEGLPHNFITSVTGDGMGGFWISTPTNYICYYKNRQLKKIKISTDNDLVRVNSMCLGNDGKLWLATYGNGIYYMKDTSFVNINSAGGLLSDYCYSIICDETGTIWTGHRQGLTSIAGDNIKQYGKARGIVTDCSMNAVCNDKDGIVWVGTTNGILRYDYRKNYPNVVPPSVHLNSIRFNDVEIQDFSKIIMPYGKYKVKMDFTGIIFRDPELVKYSFKLSGFDTDWSEPAYSGVAAYSRLEDGNYTFLIKACNADGYWVEKPYSITFTIEKPIWKKWWAITLFIIILIYSLYLFIKIRERNHRRLEEILQRKLDERTKEVVRQKELIEQKNKDITDSINYAKRIQEAILPSQSRLRQVFPESFIIYLPRDIVSGDFYIFHKSESKYVLICADATGHGVPGAFMSLISSTILKDLLQKTPLISPSKMLNELDREIQQLLQAEENSSTNDGLDISICEIDLVSLNMCFASAMRPLFICRKDSFEYIKGSKFSIGASRYIAKKEFTEYNTTMNKGDTVYLFSDGFPDQFSFDTGKKLKISGFRNWLQAVNYLPMNEQQNKLEKMFHEWKGNYPQIDDVLLIGIRF